MNIRKSSIALLMALVMTACLTACSSIYYPPNVLHRIEKGMTLREVTRLLGKPDYKRTMRGLVEWEYRRLKSKLDPNNTVIILQFRNGRLTRIDSFSEPQRPPRHRKPDRKPPHRKPRHERPRRHWDDEARIHHTSDHIPAISQTIYTPKAYEA